MAIVAIVLSLVALMACLGVGLFVFFGTSFGGSEPYVLTGSVDAGDRNVLAGPLEAAVTKAIEDDDGSVDSITCPARSTVDQGLVALCRGSVDGYEWAGVVVFQDKSGRFVLTEYDVY